MFIGVLFAVVKLCYEENMMTSHYIIYFFHLNILKT